MSTWLAGAFIMLPLKLQSPPMRRPACKLSRELTHINAMTLLEGGFTDQMLFSMMR